MKKLIPALILLLVSAMVMSTASYAWFSMNREVSATGMSLTATAPTNLVISNASGGTYDATAAIAELYSGKIFPASTADGLIFHAIANENVIGAGLGGLATSTTKFLLDEEVLPLAANDDSDDELKTGYYVDYKLYLKATADSETPLNIGVKSVSASSADAIKNAVRVAIVVGEGESASATIYAVDGTSAVLPIATVTSADAGDFTKATEDPKEDVNDDGVTAFTVTPKVNELGAATEITVRVWIEGEHEACVNANAAQSFEIAIEFYVIGA